MVMDMGLVRVRTHHEGMFAFEKSRGEVITDLVCLFRCDFSRLKGLSNLISNDIVPLVLSGVETVLSF